MPAALIPPNDDERLSRLRALAVLDTPPEPLFDAMVRMAAQVCDTPIALVSLVDAGRQWFKAELGLGGVQETPRDQAFCAHAILGEGLLEVQDAHTDPRFQDNPLVQGAPDIRFYAGMPLTLPDGHKLGTLCVIDREPRQLSDTQRQTLRTLAEATCAALVMRGQALAQALQAKTAYEAELQEREQRYRVIVEDQTELISLATPEGKLRFVNTAYARFFGKSTAMVVGSCLYDNVPPAEREALRAHLARLLTDEDEVLHGENRVLDHQGRLRWVAWTNRCLRDAEGRPTGIHSVGRDITAWRDAREALRVQQERLDLATQANGIGIWELDLHTNQLVWSEQMFRIYGCTPDQFGGELEDWRRAVHPDDRAHAEAAFQATVDRGRPLDMDFRVLHPDGSLHCVNARGHVVFDEQGRPERVLGTNLDVTERKRMARDLAEKHELLRVTLMSIGDAVITTDEHGCVRWLNPVAERMTGWRTIEAMARPLRDVFVIQDELTRSPSDCPVQRCLREGELVPHHQLNMLMSRNGVAYGIEESAAPIRDDRGQVLGAILVFRDVTEQRRMGREMSFRATHDPLTGLINRSEFERRLQQQWQEAQVDQVEHTLMCIDLDQFKLVNDACGHAMGDQLLKQVASLLQDCVRAHDTVARLGGDEFAVILSHCPVEQAQRAAQKICDALDDHRFIHEGRRFRVGASIGLAPVDQRWTSIAQAQQAADSACYAAKEAGRNRVHAWYDTDQVLKDRQGETQWATRLEQAVDDNLFVLFAQRITPLNPAPGQGLHAELLLRLRGPDGKLIPPGAFLPAAERFHMASRIDRWVLRRAFQVLDAQVDAHSDALDHVATIAINLSGQSIGDSSFHAFVEELLTHARFDVRKLCLEITETAVITKLQDAQAFIAAVRQHGVRLSLDDFGAGASSFGYLKQLQVDYLKIDGQFIRELTHDVLDQAAVRCFHDVARVLGIQTVAEFVEDEATVAVLREIGIDYAQGYHYHRPEPMGLALTLSPLETAGA
jgi:diguanylate cyclase (GGDEF)-like protein/PAS domain S-box-containing protein